MRKLPLLLAAGAIGLFADSAWAQANNAAPAADEAVPLKLEDLDPGKPFGDTDISGAGTTREALTAWLATLPPDVPGEIRTRCDLMTGPGDVQFQESDLAFCGRLAEVN